MNSIKIEMGAINSIKTIITKHDLMHPYIKDNEKEPTWDGFIYLYKSDDLKTEDIGCRVPVQIKGKNKEDLLDSPKIGFPVEYKHLRNFYNDGGVFYIVVVISNDKERTSVFYNPLTTIKLKELLKNTEDKGPDQTKSITLQRLEGNDHEKLYKVLVQFGMDREKQGSGRGEIAKKAIDINMMNRVDSIVATSYLAETEIDIFKEISSGEISLYGHHADIGMWLPFEYSFQKGMIFKKVIEIEKPLGIDGVNYYDNYIVERKAHKDGDEIIRVSENLTIDLFHGKFNFSPKGKIETLLRDVRFIRAIEYGNSFYLDNKKILNFNNVNIPKKLDNKMDFVIKLNGAFVEIGFTCNKRVADFTEENWESINELLIINDRKIKLEENCNGLWHMWYWDDKVVPLYLVRNNDEQIDVINWFTTKKYRVYVEKDKVYHFPPFSLFKRDILEKLYDVDRSIWFKEIEKIENIKAVVEEIYQSFVELVAAYDITKNELYFDVAYQMINNVLEVLPEDEYGIINKMQLVKRKRELSNDEVIKLEEIECKSNNSLTKCAVNILIDNKGRARKLISKLSAEEQKTFMSFPIYSLL